MITDNGQLVIDLPGIFTLIVLGGFAVWGWVRGFRWIVTIAGAVTIGYMLTVPDGGVIITIINGLYGFTQRLLAILIPPLGNLLPPAPIIEFNFEAPLLMRFLGFVIAFALGVGWKGPWEGTPLKGFGKVEPLRLLGGLTGLYLGILTVSAIATFWRLSGIGGFPPWVATLLDSLPTFNEVVVVFIVAFFGLLSVILFLQFVRSLQAPAAKK